MPHVPCPDCQTHGLNCATRPKCVTHRGTHHLAAWGCCDECVTDIGQLLDELIDLHAMANHPTALMPTTTGDPGPLGARRDPPPPLNIDALDLALGEAILGVLEDWERFWREAFHLNAYGRASEARLSHGNPEVDSTPTSRTLVGVVGFLGRFWPTAAQSLEPPPEEFAQEVRTLHRQAMTALALTRHDMHPDLPEPYDWTIRCPRDIDDQGTMCGHRIGMRRRPLPVDGRPLDPISVSCEKCGARWDTARLLMVAAAAGTRVEISVDDAMAHWGVSRATIYRMVNRGELLRGAHGRVGMRA